MIQYTIEHEGEIYVLTPVLRWKYAGTPLYSCAGLEQLCKSDSGKEYWRVVPCE